MPFVKTGRRDGKDLFFMPNDGTERELFLIQRNE